MTLGYYPGCTLKTKAKNLEDSALACLSALGIEATELPRWNCCGAVFSLSDDDLIHHIAPVRDLIRAQDAGHTRLVTLCSMCYNTLARANKIMKAETEEDAEKRKTLNLFMDEENDYNGDIEVLHYLDLLRTDVGWDKLAAAVNKPLEGLRVGGYYGCTLLRPTEVAIEPAETPAMFNDFIKALGATPVEWDEATACCSAYQIIANESAALDAAAKVLQGATDAKLDAMATSCPVCEYNLGRRQDDVREGHGTVGKIPTYYFTQLMAVALGLPQDDLGLEYNMPSSTELLRDKSYL